jgi:hypothetical protein
MVHKHRPKIRCAVHRNYSLTCEEFEALWARAEGRCELCGTDASKLVIDHDHRYGMAAVRGLVCTRCNLYIGAFEKLMTFPGMKCRNPGGWFRPYFRRAWFARDLQTDPLPPQVRANHDRIRADMAYYRRARTAATCTSADDILLSLGSPYEIAQILRERMSPQGFAVLAKRLSEMTRTPKRLQPE